MMRSCFVLCLCLTSVWSGCSITFTPVISPSELDATERGAFTDDGRFFVIGSHPAGRSDAGEWIVEITRASDTTQYAVSNLLAGTIEGTSDGTLDGTPVGDPCKFSGMKTQGQRIYAACVALSPSWRAALIEVDLRTRSVRAGYITTCNEQPASSPCEPLRIYPNGLALDAAGRIYVSNMLEYLRLADDVPTIEVESTATIRQILLDPHQPQTGKLAFTHNAWFGTDIVADSIGPNGIQIDGQVLYYAAGANINRVEIGSDGRAGSWRVHYLGPELSFIDDFAILNGRMLLARAIMPALVAIDVPDTSGTAPELGTRDMDLDKIPSSVAFQADIPAGRSLFPVGTALVTSEFGGGLYLVRASAP